ncbi:MAG: hypothetical protein NZ809_04410 [Thermodesulfovibrio sp.]|nr:hypothetical protein [Thermodesulfovibrio sp.]
MLSWDWQTKEKVISNLNDWKEKFSMVHDLIVSLDGEKIAAPVEIKNKVVTMCINGKIWENTFERVSFPQFTKDGNLICLALQNYEWTLAKDDILLEESFDYAWNLKTEGEAIAFNIKKVDSYGVCLNGKVWDNLYFDVRDLFISPDGSAAASYVRIKNPPLLDIFSFKEGVWSIAVNGIVWDKSFISVYGICFSPDSKSIAATVRLSEQEFTVAVNGKLWNETFLNAWEPIFINESDILAPVKTEKGWSLALNGKIVWKYFSQIWHQRVTPDGRIAAVVSPDFGKWTVALDGIPWKRTFSQAVLPPFFSPNGKKVGTVVRENNLWTVAIDGKPWDIGFDRIWLPQFSPDANHCIAKAEKDGVYFIVLDGKIGKDVFDMMWEPQFSPEGDKILVRCIKNGKYIRKILSFSEVFR